MDTNDWVVRSVALPPASRATRFYPRTDLADAFAVGLPTDAADDPELLARFIFENQPAWIARLMQIRDTVVTVFGLKTARRLRRLPSTPRQRRVGIFRVYETSSNEVLLGEDDSHLDFRVSVLMQAATPTGQPRQLVVSTVVHCHNLLGRVYIGLIAPFHRRVVRAGLERAARAGWPTRQAT
jgi:hypothetical protein